MPRVDAMSLPEVLGLGSGVGVRDAPGLGPHYWAHPTADAQVCLDDKRHRRIECGEIEREEIFDRLQRTWGRGSKAAAVEGSAERRENGSHPPHTHPPPFPLPPPPSPRPIAAHLQAERNVNDAHFLVSFVVERHHSIESQLSLHLAHLPRIHTRPLALL